MNAQVRALEFQSYLEESPKAVACGCAIRWYQHATHGATNMSWADVLKNHRRLRRAYLEYRRKHRGRHEFNIQ